MGEATALYQMRLAVRRELMDLNPGDRVIVATSGGADSSALAAALLIESAKISVTPIAVIIDHSIQENSAEIAQNTKSELIKLGYTSIEIIKIKVEISDGMEASARRARYAALNEIAKAKEASAIFLGHTKNDQAETVLLGLARGSGTRSLSGMASRIDNYRRPLLNITRAETESACDEAGISYWLDPHNQSMEFKRVRVRERVLPMMEAEIGPGITEALVRSAKILRDDADALDEWAGELFSEMDPLNLECELLASLPRAIRSRILRMAIYLAGAPSGAISAEHIEPVEALVTDWKGQGGVSLPGGVTIARISGRLSLSSKSSQ
jgi:tRNA(Ile)-lysidine synthase